MKPENCKEWEAENHKLVDKQIYKLHASENNTRREKFSPKSISSPVLGALNKGHKRKQNNL